MNLLLITPALLLIELSRSNGKQLQTSRSVIFWLAWALEIAAILLFLFNSPIYSMQIGGLFQRQYWLVLVLWLILKSLQVLKGDSAHSTSGRIEPYLTPSRE